MASTSTTVMHNVDQWTRVLAMYAGRDKAARSLYCWLVLTAQRMPSAERRDRVMALARQLSAARLVLRQFNHPSMITASWQLAKARPADRVPYPLPFLHIIVIEVDHGLTVAGTAIYTVYGVVELFAWLAEARIVNADAARLFRYCLYLWIAALIAGLLRSSRNLVLGKARDRRQEWMSVVSQTCDLVTGIHALPFKFLWSGRLSVNQNATFSLIASVIGFAKLF